MDIERQIIEELKEIKQFCNMQTQINKDILIEIRTIRRELEKQWQV
jgi:hypothetical protein